MTATFVDHDDVMARADRLADRFGLKPVLPTLGDAGKRGNPHEYCDGCGQQMDRRRRCVWKRASYEYDEWDCYCSRVCAAGYSQPAAGTVGDWLQRMGWHPWTEDGRMEKLAGDEVLEPIAREGDEVWRRDRAFAIGLEWLFGIRAGGAS